VTIENLIKAVPPPAEPGDPFTGPWAPIEAELGIALPQDYKDFVRLYGLGYFMEFLGIDVPRSRNPNTRLEHQVRLVCDVMREVGGVTHPLWPEPGGLLPFGGTDNGDTLMWLTRGAPEDWKVAALSEDSFGELEIFDCDLTDFLAGLATGEIQSTVLPDDLLPCDRMFVPDFRPPEDIIQVTWRLGSFGAGASGSSSCRLQGRG
jgi:hypothetical protein